MNTKEIQSSSTGPAIGSTQTKCSAFLPVNLGVRPQRRLPGKPSMLSLKTAFPATSQSEIEKFESEIGARLPVDYRSFLLLSNGGEPVGGYFSVAGWGSSVIHFFYGLNTGFDAYNLDWSASVLEDVLPQGIIPIACDPGGYLICLNTIEPRLGKIYLWDRADQLHLVAPSFTAFLDSLRSSNDVASQVSHAK